MNKKTFFYQMSKHFFITTCFALSFLLLSCKKDTKYEVSGKVINKVTGEAIEGAKVKLQDGIATSDPILPSDGPSTRDETYTDSNGIYHLKIKTKGNHAVLQAGKKGYEFKLDWEGSYSSWMGVEEGVSNQNLELQGLAYFNAPFEKNSATPDNNDSLYIHLLSYDNLLASFNDRQAKFEKGIGPFSAMNIDYLTVLGDRYLRYKLEWTTQGIWHSKIDSVFLPTSQEVYRETIYY